MVPELIPNLRKINADTPPYIDLDMSMRFFYFFIVFCKQKKLKNRVPCKRDMILIKLGCIKRQIKSDQDLQTKNPKFI